ncbi:hypothetical protein ACVWWO_005614 [Bradyrhizobium sp. F1.13.1]
MNMMTAISTDAASPAPLPSSLGSGKTPTLCKREPVKTVKVHEREKLAEAFRDLESDVCDLARMALLAERQLQRAIGDLRYENGVCVEVPDTEDVELAMLAASLLTEKVRDLKREWYRRFDAAIPISSGRTGPNPPIGRS